MIETPPRAPRLDALTGVRFFAAIHVVLFHNAGFFSGTPAWVQSVIHHGYSGVSLFFVLSGFILAYTYLGRATIDVRAFLVARVARIYPAYLFALALALPLYVYFQARTLLPGQAVAKSLIMAMAETTLLQAWVPHTMGGANPPGWSLSVEAFLYLAFPLVGLWLAGQRNRRLVWSIVVLWILAIAPGVVHAIMACPEPTLPGPTWLLPREPFWNLAFANPVLNLAQFAAGVGAGVLYLRGVRFSASTGVSTLSELALIAAAVAAFFATSAGLLTEPMMNTGFLAIVYLPLLFVLANGRGLLGRMLSHRWFVLLGGASYGIYILQYPVRSWLELGGRLLFGLEWNAAFFAVYVAVLITASVMVFFAEERIRPPLRRYLLRKVGALRAQPTESVLA